MEKETGKDGRDSSKEQKPTLATHLLHLLCHDSGLRVMAEMDLSPVNLELHPTSAPIVCEKLNKWSSWSLFQCL